MKGAQPKLQPLCRAAIVKDFDPAAIVMSTKVGETRSFPKLLDDSGLERGLEIGPAAGHLCEGPESSSPNRPPVGRTSDFCVQRSDFKPLSSSFYNLSRMHVAELSRI